MLGRDRATSARMYLLSQSAASEVWPLGEEHGVVETVWDAQLGTPTGRTPQLRKDPQDGGLAGSCK